MRAPPESFSPTMGAPTFIARSISLQIFAAFVSEREPPNTVKSCAKTKIGRPSTRAVPATTPSPRISFCGPSIPKSRQRGTRNGSISSKEPGSPSSSTRSRAESLPALCCFSSRSAPPPARAAPRRAPRRAIRCSAVFTVRSQGDLLLRRQPLLRDAEHLRVVGARRLDRLGVLLQELRHLGVELALAVAVERERGLQRAAQVGHGGRLHDAVRHQAPRQECRLRGEACVGEGHGESEHSRCPTGSPAHPSLQSKCLNRGGADVPEDAEDAVRLVAGMRRRGESGEAMREHRRVTSWSASEAGLLSPAAHEERGTAVRIRRGGASLLVARAGDGPAALREAIREAARRGGTSPFLKSSARGAARVREATPEPRQDDELPAPIAGPLAHALPDPRGVSLPLTASLVSVSRAVVTPRAYLPCGAALRLEATGRVVRGRALRHVAFQSSLSLPAAFAALEIALKEALRPRRPVAAPSGEVDVVLSPSASAVFWHEAVGHPLEAEGADRASVLARLQGALVGPPRFELLDDPTRVDLPGAYLVDDEGVAARATALVKDGRVAGLLTDRRTAGAESNGHGRASDYRRPPRPRMSNLVGPPGDAA